ncbi:uncharacterized protein LOC123600564 [Leopardus geoffroyi]|uniref:uncharacterized protein LOC123600564 n=1 Tax=Leopardus geoffroyi TaxID=46844 RepID=UPI001E263649|nr:uncharacterized protein LOC123600564 [Leopardus geoffroyi]
MRQHFQMHKDHRLWLWIRVNRPKDAVPKIKAGRVLPGKDAMTRVKSLTASGFTLTHRGPRTEPGTEKVLDDRDLCLLLVWDYRLADFFFVSRALNTGAEAGRPEHTPDTQILEGCFPKAKPDATRTRPGHLQPGNQRRLSGRNLLSQRRAISTCLDPSSPWTAVSDVRFLPGFASRPKTSFRRHSGEINVWLEEKRPPGPEHVALSRGGRRTRVHLAREKLIAVEPITENASSRGASDAFGAGGRGHGAPHETQPPASVLSETPSPDAAGSPTFRVRRTGEGLVHTAQSPHGLCSHTSVDRAPGWALRRGFRHPFRRLPFVHGDTEAQGGLPACGASEPGSGPSRSQVRAPLCQAGGVDRQVWRNTTSPCHRRGFLVVGSPSGYELSSLQAGGWGQGEQSPAPELRLSWGQGEPRGMGGAERYDRRLFFPANV